MKKRTTVLALLLVVASFLMITVSINRVKKISANELVKEEELSTGISNNSLDISLSLGETEDRLIKLMGNPDRIDINEFGNDLYIYNRDIRNYIQIGIRDKEIVSFETNSSNWSVNNIEIGMKKVDIENQYNTRPTFYEYIDKIELDYNVLNLMWDSHTDYSLSAMYLHKDTGISEVDYTKEVVKGMEKQVHDFTNGYRARHKLNSLYWRVDMERLANYHNNDMVNNKFFSHDSSNGDTFEERIMKVLGSPRYAGENLVMGADNALYSIEILYNSNDGHRETMLHPDWIGSGVSVIYSDALYVTHNFSGRR